MITRITIQDFQGISSVDLELDWLTACYGPNGAGKSSVGDAVLYCLTGEFPRHERVGELVRQSGKQLMVEILADVEGQPRSLMRWRTPSGGEQFIDGAKVTLPEFEAAVVAIFGITPRAIAAALRAGALLDLKPDELQAFLLSMTGASFDATAIRESLSQPVLDALALLKLPVPGSLPEVATVGLRAVDERKRAKALRDDRVADLTRVPVVPQAVAAALAAATSDAIALQETAAAERLEQAHRQNAAASGRDEGRAAALRENLAILRKVPRAEHPDLRAAQHAYDRARVLVQDTTGELERLRRQLAQSRQRAGEPCQLPADAEGIDGRVERAEAEHAQAKAHLAQVTDEGKRAAAALAAVQAGKCPTCEQAVTDELRQTMEARCAKLRERYTEAAGWVKERKAELDQVTGYRMDLDMLKVRAEAHADAAREADQIRQLDDALLARQVAAVAAEAELTDARARQQEATTWDAAQREIQRIEAELAAPAPTVAQVDLAPLEAEVERLTALYAAAQHRDRRAQLTAQLDELAKRIAAADVAAKACEPGGIRQELLSRALGPWLAVANGYLAEMAPGMSVEITSSLQPVVVRTGSRLLPAALSDGERVLVLTALQVAVAELTQAPLIVIDRVELVDEAGRKLLKAAASKATSVTQVLLLSTAAAPATLAPGIRGYSFTRGTARAIPAAAAA